MYWLLQVVKRTPGLDDKGTLLSFTYLWGFFKHFVSDFYTLKKTSTSVEAAFMKGGQWTVIEGWLRDE